MTNKQMFRGGLAALAGILLCTVPFSSLSAQQSKLRIVQSNSAGDNIHIIDPVTNKVVGEIKGIEAPHGLAVSPDGNRIYVSEEAGKSLLVVDGKTLQVTKRIPLSGNPNLIDLTPDGRWIYVAIAQTWDDLSDFPQIKAAPSGGVDVIDTASLQNVKTIPLKGGIHDLNVTPDGKYVVAGASQRRQTCGELDVRDRHADQRARMDAADESVPLSDGHIEASRRLHRQDIRAVGWL